MTNPTQEQNVSSKGATVKPLRYCNPLAVESYPVRTTTGFSNIRNPGDDMIAMADPCIVRHQGTYYLFPSGGLAWVSDDLVNWTYQEVTLPEGQRIGAPHIFEYHDTFYLSGNDIGLFRSPHPLGPWTFVGNFHDAAGQEVWLFDVMFFADDDDRVYVYYSGRATAGIYGVELDPQDLTRFRGAPRHFFGFEKTHVFERGGDANQYTEVSWIEAPWMTKHNGTYYLQYAAPGTEWQTYAVGVYTSQHPLGPFTYAPRNPILVHQRGLINGTAHHCVIAAPDGNLWMVYTMLYRNLDRFHRRIGMDPVGFDAQGNMFVRGPSETPQWGPGVTPAPWRDGDSGAMNLTLNQFTFRASSEAPGRDAVYAFDNNVRTWWEPARDDPAPWLMIDLGSANPTDPRREFVVDSLRLLFSDLHLNAAKGVRPGPYRYKLETSLDGESFTLLLDKTDNTLSKVTEFDELEPTRCRYVRLTITGAPQGLPIGLLEFTVFGKPVESSNSDIFGSDQPGFMRNVVLGELAGGERVSFVRQTPGLWGIEVIDRGAVYLQQPAPVRVEFYAGEDDVRTLDVGYDRIEITDVVKGDIEAWATVAGLSGASVTIHDHWSLDGATLAVQRDVQVHGEAPGGFTTGLFLATPPDVSWADLDLFAPGLLYGDPTHNGEHAPGGTIFYARKNLAIREDFLSAPLLGLSLRDGRSIAVLDPAPRGNTTMEESMAEPGVTLIDARYQFGALGARETAGGNVEFGFWLPGTCQEIPRRLALQEPVWRRRYHPLQDGFAQHYAVRFRLGQAESFATMTQQAYRWAWKVLRPQVPHLDLEVVRRALIDHLADRVKTINGHTGIPLWADTIVEGELGEIFYPFIRPPHPPRYAKPPRLMADMSFVGKNVEAADQFLREAERDVTPRGRRLRELGLAIIDSFVHLLPMNPPVASAFYIEDGEPTALLPHLDASLDPWFLREVTEDMRMLMEAYRREARQERKQPEWLQWCRDFCDWLLPQQRQDGSFPRGWRLKTSEVAETSGTSSYNVVPLFVLLSEETGDDRYLQSAIRAAEYVWAAYASKGVYVGGTLDNPNVVDKEAGMLSLEGFIMLYEATKEQKWLTRARGAADYTATWVWIWNVPMPEDANNAELHWKKGVPTIGVQGISARGAGGVDEYMDWSAPAYARMYRLTHDPYYLEVARVLLHGTKGMLALPGRTYDMLGPGWQQEHWSMGPNARGFGVHRTWLPWISTNHLYSITGLEAAEPELFRELCAPPPLAGGQPAG